MAIKTENLTINGRAFVRTYSDAGRCVVGGSPEGAYSEAIDPAEFNRQYTEGEIMPDNEAFPEDYENALSDLGVRFGD